MTIEESISKKKIKEVEILDGSEMINLTIIKE
jgi:hypothetical protein